MPLLILMMFTLPLWVTFGKGLIFGVGGWLALISIFTIAPALFVVFLIFALLLMTRKDVIESRRLGVFDSVLLLILYLSIFLFSIFVVDGGDTPESVDSVMSKYNFVSQSLSGQLSEIFMLSSVLLIIVGFVIFIFEAMKRAAITLPQR